MPRPSRVNITSLAVTVPQINGKSGFAQILSQLFRQTAVSADIKQMRRMILHGDNAYLIQYAFGSREQNIILPALAIQFKKIAEINMKIRKNFFQAPAFYAYRFGSLFG